MTILKTIQGAKGHTLGEIFETNDGFGFYHAPTSNEKTGFADFEAALDGWHCFHDDYFENLPRHPLREYLESKS